MSAAQATGHGVLEVGREGEAAQRPRDLLPIDLVSQAHPFAAAARAASVLAHSEAPIIESAGESAVENFNMQSPTPAPRHRSDASTRPNAAGRRRA